MKRSFLSIIIILAMATALLTGCQSGSGSNIASESRKGVARVWLCSDYCTLYVEDTLTGISVPWATDIYMDWVGSAFGVGTAGEETQYFVTNRHVAKLHEDIDPIAYKEVDSGFKEYYEQLDYPEGIRLYLEGNPTMCYILEDDYAITTTGDVDLSRCTPCDVIYTAKEDEPDLAVLRAAEVIDGREALPLLAKGGSLDSGDTVYALGYPITTDIVNSGYAADIERVTITAGVVSLHNKIDIDNTTVNVIQHTADINHGNSGGPLIDENGAVVGVNTWGVNYDGTTNYYSIEIDYVRNILDSQEIHYDVLPDSNGNAAWIPIAIAIAVIVVIVIVVILFVLKKNKKNGSASQPASIQQAESETGHSSIAGDSGLRIQGDSGFFAGRRFAVSGQVRIGRNPTGNDLVYPENTPGVSGSHCMLFIRDGQLYLQDVGSSNGTFLFGGRRLSPNQAVILHVGDRFYLATERECFVVAQKGGV